jgi:hypothetical protein
MLCGQESDIARTNEQCSGGVDAEDDATERQTPETEADQKVDATARTSLGNAGLVTEALRQTNR